MILGCLETKSSFVHFFTNMKSGWRPVGGSITSIPLQIQLGVRFGKPLMKMTLKFTPWFVMAFDTSYPAIMCALSCSMSTTFPSKGWGSEWMPGAVNWQTEKRWLPILICLNEINLFPSQRVNTLTWENIYSDLDFHFKTPSRLTLQISTLKHNQGSHLWVFLEDANRQMPEVLS